MKRIFFVLGFTLLSTKSFAFTKMICKAYATHAPSDINEALVPTAFKPTDLLSYEDKKDALGKSYAQFEVNPYAWNSGQEIDMSWTATVLTQKLNVNLKMREVASGIEVKVNEAESGQAYSKVIPFNNSFIVQRPANGDAYFMIHCDAQTSSKSLSR